MEEPLSRAQTVRMLKFPTTPVSQYDEWRASLIEDSKHLDLEYVRLLSDAAAYYRTVSAQPPQLSVLPALVLKDVGMQGPTVP